jgi:hypothetical protein
MTLIRNAAQRPGLGAQGYGRRLAPERASVTRTDNLSRYGTVMCGSSAPMETQEHHTHRSFDEDRNVPCIEKLISDMLAEADELEQEIALEETRVGVFDPQHFAYPTYAKAAMLRRDNLRRSVEALRTHLE